MNDEQEIEIADHFYTLQGEGTSTGKPAYFIRTQGCNLQCGNPDWSEVDDRSDYDEVKEAQGDNASWTCDTMTTDEGGWMSGDTYTFEELEKEMEEEIEEYGGGWEYFENGQANIVITGGEPLMRQDDIADFLDYLGAEDYNVEVETNATIKPNEHFDQFVDQYNTSPKLSNSGNQEFMRYKPEVIKWHRDNEGSHFKFVTANEEDTQEIMDEWVDEFDIDPHDVLLMPAGADQKSLQKRQQEVAELAKEHGFRYSERVHISIWDEMTSV